jgi:hypothetical protein
MILAQKKYFQNYLAIKLIAIFSKKRSEAVPIPEQYKEWAERPVFIYKINVAFNVAK